MKRRQGRVFFNGYWVPAECELSRMKLATENAHMRDKNIAFRDDTHTYYIKGVVNTFDIIGVCVIPESNIFISHVGVFSGQFHS